MKTFTGLLIGLGVVFGIFGLPDKPLEGVAIVTFGPTEPPLLPPRVRVTNDRRDGVDIWYLAQGAEAMRKLGTVAANTTHTFAIPHDVTVMRLLVLPRASRAQFETDAILIDGATDVYLEVAHDIERSVVEVSDLQVVSVR